MKDDIQPCPCCGQQRPFPTKPGKWKFREYKTWTEVEVKLDEEGLTITPLGEDDPIWWPNNAEWVKLDE